MDLARIRRRWRCLSAKRQAPRSEQSERATQAANGLFPDRRSNQHPRPFKTLSTGTRRFHVLLERRCHTENRGHPPNDVSATRVWLPLHPRALICRHALGLARACTRPTACRRPQRYPRGHLLSTFIPTRTTRWSLPPATTIPGRRNAVLRLRSRRLPHPPTIIKTCRPIPPWLMWLSLLLLNRQLSLPRQQPPSPSLLCSSAHLETCSAATPSNIPWPRHQLLLLCNASPSMLEVSPLYTKRLRTFSRRSTRYYKLAIR
jgi:hypothetical protein